MAKNNCDICDKIVSIVQSTDKFIQVSLGSGKTVLDHSTKCTIHQKIVSSAIDLNSLPNSFNQLELIQDIRDIRVVKIMHNGASVLVTDLWSQDQDRIPKRAAFYVRKTPDAPANLVGGRMIDPKWIDRRLPLLWKESCARLHRDSCGRQSVPVLSGIIPALLVDVHEQCVIVNSNNHTYVALSYVWGGQQGLLATKANISTLRRPNSLAEPSFRYSLPKTIRDALGIVKLLGERYLWVDTLCIVQDEGLQKQEELSKMGGIYANSTVTILAMQGQHANFGLRGFSGISESRNLHHVVHHMTDRTTILQFPADGPFHDIGSSNTVWSTRAWTYQENICSRRRLIFDGDSLRWDCMETVWREHIDGDNINLLALRGGMVACRSMLRSSVPDFTNYQVLLQEYNCRNFSFPEDAASAFIGISYTISAAVGGELITGLPSACFDVFMLWSPKPRVTRRLANNPDKYHSLPSWSWIGWSGAISIRTGSAEHFLKKSTSRIHRTVTSDILVRLVNWRYHEKPDGPGTAIEPSILKYRESWLKNELNLGSEWSVHHISESPESENDAKNLDYTPLSFFKNTKHPEFEFRYPIPIPEPGSKPSVINPPFLSCSTRRTYLHCGERIHSLSETAPTFSLYDRNRRWAGALEPLVRVSASGKHMEVDKSELLEVVELARGCCPNTTASETLIEETGHPGIPDTMKDGWYHFYWVMWIEWHGGIAYRRGIGRVCSAIWEAQDRKSIDLMLG